MLQRWGLALLLPTCLGAAPFDKGAVLGAGAREAGQAGAVVARVDGPQGLWWNPGTLGLRRDFQLGAGYGDLLGSFRFQSELSHRGWLDGAALGYGLGYRRHGFSVDVAEEEYALGFAFPFTQDGRLQAGFALRALQARVLGVKAPGYGVDLGLHYTAPGPLKGLSVGLAARDMQAALEWPAGPRSDPAQLFQAGLAWQFDEASSLELDSEFVSDPSASGRGSQGYKLGAERWWDIDAWGLKRAAALRLGYLQSSALAPAALGGQFSGGVGARYKGLSADYAYIQGSGSFGPSHRFGVEYAFAPGPQTRRSPTPRPSPTPSASPTPGIGPLELGLRAEPPLFNPSKGDKLQLRVVAPEGAVAESSLVEIRPLSGPQWLSAAPRAYPWISPGMAGARAGATRRRAPTAPA